MSPAIILDMKIPRQRAEPHYVSDRVIVLRRPAVRYRAGRRKDHPQPVSESCTSQETLALCIVDPIASRNLCNMTKIDFGPTFIFRDICRAETPLTPLANSAITAR